MLKLQYRIFLAFLLFVLFPIIVLGAVSYHLSSLTLKKNIVEQTLRTLKAVDLNLASSFSSVDSFSDYVISSQEIHDFLKYNDKSFVKEFYSKRQALAGMMYGYSKVDDYILYSVTGNVYHFKNSRVLPYAKLQSTSFFRDMIQQKGRPVWLGPTENTSIVLNNKLFFTQGRVVKDLNTLENIGYLVINIKLEMLDRIYQDVRHSNSEELIINEQGKILYSFNHNHIGYTIPIRDLPKIVSGEEGALLSNWYGKKCLITFYPSRVDSFSNSKLILLSIKPWDDLSSEIDYIRNITIFIVISGVVFATLFNVIYLKRILSFLKEFVWNMRRVENGDLTVRMNHFKFFELEHLSLGFNKMIERIEKLLEEIKSEQERKREAEFRVLQQQINPHFLYNTLESINSLAALNGQREISNMTINLGKLLRISINGAYEVKVEDEIRHVMSYLEIQKIRYNNRFMFEIDVDEQLKDCFVLKLILQPLVENALYHAFDQERTDGWIRIKGRISHNQGCFYVEDNGKGMSNVVLNELQMESVSRKMKSKNRGHGISNVQERLKLFYGNQYGLMICSMENKGTIIKVSFPLYNKGG
ncbi:cache domain-containing sensor histidine kinase [Geobacillus subterraneus]|uniref:cache domain-containing sensor histidine kinase n=1 Tax=Geobacillus subterraneus TaxID=129338 RepID=UPI001620F536